MPSGYSKSMHLATLILSLFGILMVMSASMGIVQGNVRNLIFTGLKEFVFVVIGYVGMVFMARYFSFNFFKKHFGLITMAVFVLLLSALAFSPVNGARAWIRLGKITIQPSEFAKIYMMIMIAVRLGDKQRISSKVSAIDLVSVPFLILMAMSFVIIKLQGDFGSALVIAGITVICFLIPTNQKLWPLQKWTMVLIVLAFVCVFFFTTPTGLNFLSALGIPSYMLKRFMSAAEPFKYRYGDSYQLYMGIASMVKGVQAGFFGRGFGNSINKFGYLPEQNTDFISAIVVEELGVFGICIIVVGYATIIYTLLKKSVIFKKERDKILLIGCASYLLIHIILNIGGVTGLIPLTGVPLLLISAGGSGRMAFMMAIGLAQNVIARNQGKRLVQERGTHENRIG